MNCLGNISAPAFSTENGIFPLEVNAYASPKGDAEDVGDTISWAGAFPLMSISGVVNAILEVGNQRKALLGQLRSALDSGNDSEALGFARLLCGLPA
jgi:hypothetical protein